MTIRIAYRYKGTEEVKEINSKDFIIGRGVPHLDLSPDTNVSRRHARVWVENGVCWIEDLGSKFGTRVNGEEISRQGKRRLPIGAQVVVGDTLLRLETLPDSMNQPLRPQGSARYALIHELGCGRVGTVWLAEDTVLGEKVVLKFLPDSVRSDPRELAELRSMTLLNLKLTHPNIIRIHDLHEHPDEAPFISMEYVDGTSLNDLRLAEPLQVMSWTFLDPLAKQICEALNYAHGEGAFCPDLWPAKLMVDGKARLKVGEFHVARGDSHLPKALIWQKNRETRLPYLSPQRIAGQPPCAADDIYSLGATLYELLASQPPCSGNIVQQASETFPIPLQERLAALNVKNYVPTHVAAMVMACLAKDPSQRPQTPKDVADWIR